jgi:hypothetical protein
VWLSSRAPWQPFGNFYACDSAARGPRESLGPLFGRLTDTSVLNILECLLAADLCRVSRSSHAFYCFAHHDELWKVLTLRDAGGEFDFDSCWKQTFLRATLGAAAPRHRPQRVAGVYSDLLFQPWLCASLRLKPRWLARDNIDRRAGLSVEDFVREYEGPNRPVVITDVVPTWDAFKRFPPRAPPRAPPCAAP